MNIVLIYAAGWVGLVILAIFNGVIRVKTYAPFMSELSAHQVSTDIGLCLLICTPYLFYEIRS